MFRALWWFTDGWDYFGLGRETTAQEVVKVVQSEGFSGMLADYPNGGTMPLVT